MRNVRVRRRGFLDLRQLAIGDYIVLIASLFTVASLFMTWFITTVPNAHGEWAFTYSEVASVVVIVFFLATVFLVLYPVISREVGLAPLPFATPVVLLTMGSVLLLLFTYELGKYDCVLCQGSSRGFGVWVAFIAAWVYITGALIKWGARPAQTFQS
jgi:hypothetical protein